MRLFSNKVVISVSPPPRLSIYVLNNQSIATPSNLQVMFQIPLTTLQKYFGGNVGFQNLRIRMGSLANAYLLNGWIESISNGIATVWVKIPVSIPANSEIELYLEYSPLYNYDGQYWGIAPQLTSPYGEYDNGASVFLAYFNMQSNPVSSSYLGTSYYSITTATGPTGANQPLLAWTGTTGQEFAFINLATTLPSSFILTTWVKTNAGSNDVGFGAGSTTAGEWDGYVIDPGSNGNNKITMWKTSGTSWDNISVISYSQSASTWYALEFQYISGGSMTGWVVPWQNTLDASSSSTKITCSDTTYTSFNTLELFPYSASTSDVTYWALMVARAYPPNGMMPSVTIGD